MYEAHNVIRQFEETIAKYCGARYGVAVESCSAALFLCCKWWNVKEVTIPKRTYFSVPMGIINAGGTVKFKDIQWSGAYQLEPYPIWDSAVRLKKDMYISNTEMCLSFHYSKHIPIGRGGMILTDSHSAAEWFRRMRHDGRQEIPKEQDNVGEVGWNMYMTPEQAARGLSLYYWRIHGRPDQRDIDMNYDDLTRHKVFNV